MKDDIPGLVAERFDTLPRNTRARLLHWRRLIAEVAATDERIGAVTETLKWSQPSYLPEKRKTGTTVRLWVNRSGEPAIFVPCSTRLIDRARERFANMAAFEGDRAVVPHADTSDGMLMSFLTDALTYHLR